jgi:hypothetical protein
VVSQKSVQENRRHRKRQKLTVILSERSESKACPELAEGDLRLLFGIRDTAL